jgi:outer membrane lipoprotein-sorting protein
MLCLTASGPAFGQDRFEALKVLLAESDCTRFEFITILISDIFDTVDSASGVALIAADGRYRVNVNDDQYLYDAKRLYSYSPENDQVVIEEPDPGFVSGNQISFITRLDELYQSWAIRPDSDYRLVRKEAVNGNIPDSMTIRIDPKTLKIRRIEYYDVNDELTRILIQKQETDLGCGHEKFEPAFPDSVERVRL